MNLLLVILLTYITATLAAITSYRLDFHKLNLTLYAYVIFYTLIFIPQVIFVHVFYQGYMFLYFFPSILIKIYPYRLYITILFTLLYYFLFYLVIKVTERNLKEGKKHSIYIRMIFVSVLTIFILVFLHQRVLFIGTIQDYLSDTLKPFHKSITGFLAIEYLILLFLFEKMVIPKIKKITI